MNEEIFKELSPLAVKHLLELPLNTLESDIYKALVWWMRMNPMHSNAFPGLLGLVEIHLLTVYQLDMLFLPTLLIDPDFYRSLLTEQRIFAQRVQKVVNKNVIGSKDELRIVNGQKTLENAKLKLALARHTYCITIDLKHLFVLNCLKFKLKGNVGYAITVCKYMRNWDCVVDHFDYICTGPQVLYFDECVVRFISIRFQECVSFFTIRVGDVEALYSTDPFQKDPKTGLCIPKHQLVTMTMICGNLSNDHVRHKVNGDGSIIYQFAQPYMIGSMKLLLNEESSYYVEVATHNENWTHVFEEENVIGWRMVTFRKQAVLYIKIVGTKAPLNYFKLYKLECPAT
uniref:BACK domain-containing protein n=1 Tax=Panagrellus redivivus TaxID=6233 RepID=A0A7E4V6Q3_PANRE